MHHLLPGIAVVALAITACGSTVQSRESLGGSHTGSGQMGIDGTREIPTPPADSSQLRLGQVSGGARPGGPTGSTASGPSRSAGAIAEGVADRRPVEVGIVYSNDTAAYGAALGGSSDTGDQLVQAKAMVQWINAHGGLNGHPVVPVYTQVRLTSTESYDQIAANVCADWTQDHKVIAGILVANNANTTIGKCVTTRGAFVIQNGFYLHQRSDFRRLPYMVNAVDLAADVGASFYVDALHDQG